MKIFRRAIALLFIVLAFSFIVTAQSFSSKDVTINANVKAQVYINNILKGETPLKIKLNIGKYKIKLTANGYNAIETSIDVKSTGSNIFNFKLTPVSSGNTGNTGSSGYGTLVVTSDVPAFVYLNNIKGGETPFNKSIKAGTYTLRVEPKDKKYPAQQRQITVKANQTTQETFQFVVVKKYNISINANVPATVYINGQLMGNTPLNLTLEEGNYNLRLVPRIKGYDELNTNIFVNSNNNFYFNLEAMKAVLNINLPPSAQLYINGQKYNFNSNSTIMLEPGTYTIKIVYHELVVEKQITISANQTVTISLSLDLVISY